MDGSRFDALSRALATGPSRRVLTQLIGGLALGGPLALLAARGRPAQAKKHKKHKKRHSGASPPPPASLPSPPPSPPPPPAPTCSDTHQNGAETDVDCGGPDCPRCVASQRCATDQDCSTSRCASGVCRACAQNDQCGSDINGACFCDSDVGGDNAQERCLSSHEELGACTDCPAHLVCYSSGCWPLCGSSESCRSVPIASRDACRGYTAPCGRGGQCFQRLDGKGACGIVTATTSCGCTSDEWCVDHGHGADAFCVAITGSGCSCNGLTSFCATPA